MLDATGQPVILRGWWDGTAFQPVTVQGWWDGSTVQPLVGDTSLPNHQVTVVRATLWSTHAAAKVTATRATTWRTNAITKVTASRVARWNVSAPNSVPGPVASFMPVDGDTTITLNWTPPNNTGGSAITGYQVSRNLPDWTGTVAATVRTFTLTNFRNDTTYQVGVRAQNALGYGPWTYADVAATGTPTTPPAGNTDAFGIITLYPDLAGGMSWEANWSTARTFTGVDPSDSWFDANHGSASYSVSGGILSAGGSTIRMYVHDPANVQQWRNVEMTTYFKRVSDTSPAYAGLTSIARSNHGTIGNENVNLCDTRGVGARMRIDGHIDFEKETSHPDSTPVANKTQFSGGLPFNQWIGHKYVCYDLADGNVKLEHYIDMTDGADGGTWTKINEFVDNGSNFGVGGTACAVGVNPAMKLTAATTRTGSETGKPNVTCYWRTDNVNTNGIQYKKMSVREIDVSTVVTPPAPPPTPTPPPPTPSGTNFKSAILSTSPLHYYPMNNTYTLQDLGTKGDRPLLNTGGGVTFGTNGALFEGVSNDYLTAATTTDFSVRNPNNALAFFVAVTFPTYTQPSQFHWMSKGADQANNYEWALRLYGDGDTARARNISNYYWNPNPSFDINGNAVASRRGSGAYMAPPSASPDFGGSERHNGPVHSGEIGREHYLGFEFTYATNYAGRCRLWYGDNINAMTLLSDRAMNADALVTPVYTPGSLFIGKRGDSDGMVKATIRRVAFWNRLLTQAEWRSFANATTMGLTEG